MKREEGFYWVLYRGFYRIAELEIWTRSGIEVWLLTGRKKIFYTHDFEEIGERIIKSGNEKGN